MQNLCKKSRRIARATLLGMACGLLCLSSPALMAKDCPAFIADQDLVNPPVLNAYRGVLQTVLVAKQVEQCVPVWNDESSEWEMQSLSLRNYGYTIEPVDLSKPVDLNKLNLSWTFPGPTLKLRKANHAKSNNGDRLKIKLYNHLTPQSFHDAHECNKSSEDSPNCFHGNEVTNLHFHGSHFSPQYHQDYVLLQLYPEGSTGVPSDKPEYAVGSYDIDVDPINYQQPEGTHWYHPHKHGSTALQVVNGLSGAMIIEGPLDGWLRNYYGDQLEEKLLIVQQIGADTGSTSSVHLVNGQASPRIKIRPGEVQRWRFIGATMNDSAKIEVEFGKGFEVKQILQDGVQFSPENYALQPLNTPPADDMTVKYEFDLGPGNRIDLLVRAPSDAGVYGVSHEVVGALSKGHAAMIEARTKAMMKSESGNPSLFTVKVEGTKMDMQLPSEWPELPDYLSTPVASITKEITYTSTSSIPYFRINGQAFLDGCVMRDFTTTLNTSEKWTVVNQSLSDDGYEKPGTAHPFHIHTNPFLVTRYGEKVYDHPIWMDTIGLPTGGIPGTNGVSVEMLMHFEDFTGGYVNHCHFLNHEDQGMMQLVQTICPGSTIEKPKYGNPVETGGECFSGNLVDGLGECSK